MNHKLLMPVILLMLSSCDKMEMRGFITFYEDVNERFEQSVEWNDLHGYTEISISRESYSLHVMGDSHVGGTKNLDRFFREAMDEDAAAVILAGDITTGQQEDYNRLAAHLPSQDSLICFAVAGNHDLYFHGWKHFYSLFGSSSYFFVVHTDRESDLFICLDTGGGTLGNKQLTWFKQLLESDRNNYRHCIVFTHNNLFRLRPTTSTNPMTEELDVLVDLFTRYNIDMVVTAHDHKRNTDILGNTTHIIMDALQDVNDQASFLQISVSGEKIDYSFVEI